MIRKTQLNWLITIFFAVIIAVVFQQIHTSMSDQGIASGGPYDNAASYPRIVAILMGALVVFQLILENFKAGPDDAGEPQPQFAELRRPMILLMIFGLYLGVLNVVGYHLATTPLIFAIMWLCGSRQFWKLVIAALVISFLSAYVFENFLNIVLPGGILRLNIPW